MENLKILCAEEDAPLRRVLASLMDCALDEYNVSTDLCINGEHLLEMADPLQYDLYVLGDNMRKTTRLETLKQLRYRGDETPALLIDHEERDGHSNHNYLGKITYLTKTLTIGNLKTSLNTLLK